MNYKNYRKKIYKMSWRISTTFLLVNQGKKRWMITTLTTMMSMRMTMTGILQPMKKPTKKMGKSAK